jgi:hypothetical protein
VSLDYGFALHSDEETAAVHLDFSLFTYSPTSLLLSSIASVFHSMLFIFPPIELISSLSVPPDLILKSLHFAHTAYSCLFYIYRK